MPWTSHADQFRQNPLKFLDERFPGANGVVQTGSVEFCIGDPLVARSVLRNDAKLYQEHSDFFHTRYGLFGPRQTQRTIRREARALLRSYLDGRGSIGLSAYLSNSLPQTSQWPDTGNRLVYHYLKPLLLASGGNQKLQELLDEIVERAVLANARSRQSTLRRMILQFRTTLLLSKEIDTRRRLSERGPIDLLDVVARSADRGKSSEELSEVFLSFLFAVAGSVGFVLAWSLYLAGRNSDFSAHPKWIVQETLRLWPVAWQLGRNPTQRHRISNTNVDSSNEVVVCPYLVHRHPEYWVEPTTFQPGRWEDPEAWRNPAFIPFGHGPHRCIAADLSTQLVSDILSIIVAGNEVSIVLHGDRPSIGAAMAPPPFSLTLTPRDSE